MTNPSTVDMTNLRKELEALAEYLQAGGDPEEMLAALQELAQDTPPETPPEGNGEENEGNGEETPPETPPEAPPETDPAY